MAIDHIGEIVDAWIRGYEIVCDVCYCENVRGPLVMDYIPPSSSRSNHRVLFISHEPEPENWLIYMDVDMVWRTNVNPDLFEKEFCDRVTILKPGVECPNPFFCSLPGAPLCHICHGKGEGDG